MVLHHPRDGIGQPDVGDLADEDRPFAAGSRVVRDEEGAGDRVDARGPDGLGTIRALEADRAAGRDLASGPARPRRTTRRGGRRPGPRDARGMRRAARRRRPDARRPPRAARSSTAARAGGNAAAAQSVLMPRPTTTRGSALPSPSVSPRTPAELAQTVGRLGDEVVRPLQADRAGGETRRRLRGVGHGQRRDRGEPPGARPVRARPAGTRATAAAPRRPVRPTTGRRDRGPRSARRRPRGRPRPSHRPASRARRRWSSRRGRTARGGRGTGRRSSSVPRHPAAAAPASTASGRSSSNASCSARSAVSRSASAIMQVIRTSEVEIISMLTPASASVPNIRAA